MKRKFNRNQKRITMSDIQLSSLTSLLKPMFNHNNGLPAKFHAHTMTNVPHNNIQTPAIHNTQNQCSKYINTFKAFLKFFNGPSSGTSAKIVTILGQIHTQINKRRKVNSKQDFFLLKKNTTFFTQGLHNLNQKVIVHACT